MNNILHLKGRLEHKTRDAGGGAAKLPASGIVTDEKIATLVFQLESVFDFWKEQPDLGGLLVCADYYKVAAKSNRIKAIFPKQGDANECIVGARFHNEGTTLAHTITYFVSFEDIKNAIVLLTQCKEILKDSFDGVITCKKLEDFNKTGRQAKISNLSKSKFSQLIVDCCYIVRFYVETEPLNDYKAKNSQIVTVYKTNLSLRELFSIYDMGTLPTRGFDDLTVTLNKTQFENLYQKAPYLICMAVDDIVKISPLKFNDLNSEVIQLPPPTNEPIVGVIDTPFDGPEMYDAWVDKRKEIDPDIELKTKDYEHGTAVSTIIVNGPDFNPDLQDGCGYFRVRHFGVANASSFSSNTVIRKIKEIVSQNTDIKVWNLSLGSILEVSRNYISPEAAELDKIQKEFDVIFVIAGTNIPKNAASKEMFIGAPADSVNSLVVGSVGFDNKKTSYSRKGPVLSFYRKPDVCYYGGDEKIHMNLCSALGSRSSFGTSFAAPWITRKMAYLIHKIGLSREVAKALIIDAALGWNDSPQNPDYYGYGIVPININDVIRSKDDEIKFIINDVAEKYDTYNFTIPVPIVQGKYPYKAKATLCYFPTASRNQGVDYTDTELDLHFGRIGPKGIKSINGNNQNEDDYVYEESARQLYRKWDNVKCICETVTDRTRAVKVYDNPHWGFSIKKTNRLKPDSEPLNFGLVITLKEIDGVNRMDTFIRDCYRNNWLVNEINVEQRLNIYNIAEEEIEFE